jgi:CRP/FNR family transcriptional regulator, cyclic AMP receptor protein
VNIFLKRLFRDEEFREKMRFFRKVLLFQNLKDRSLALLVHTMMEKTYAQGEAIFEEGDVGRACFIVYQGRVELSRRTGAGRSESLGVIEPGDFFGEMALLDELPRSASARASAPTRLLILYKTGFDSLIVDAPRVASRVLHTLARLLSARLRRERFRAEEQSAPHKLELK